MKVHTSKGVVSIVGITYTIPNMMALRHSQTWTPNICVMVVTLDGKVGWMKYREFDLTLCRIALLNDP
jgi:hypothetical protein